MHAVKIILEIFALLVLIVLIFAALRPKSFRLERSATIKAAPEKIFPLINDFHAWMGWSPWEHVDSDLKRTYEGAPFGVGTIYSWQGKKTGQGRMEITESNPARKISLKLDFLKPFKANNITDFTFTPSGDSTQVTWAMYGPQPFLSRLMTIFFSMEKMVGPDFEKGLANIKALAEK